MIRKSEAIKIYQELSEATKLPEDWKLDFNKDPNNLGKCWHSQKRIIVSQFVLNSCSETEYRDTILHEIAHALAGIGHGHDEHWKEIALSIGCTSNICGVFNPNGSRSMDVSEVKEKKHIPPLTKQCPICGLDAVEVKRTNLLGTTWIKLQCNHLVKSTSIKGASYEEWESKKGYKPFPYQIEGAKFIAQSGGRCLIADEMGLGKTIQALSFPKFHPEIALPLLWVCKPTLKMQAVKEILEWCDISYFPCTIDSTKSFIIPGMKMYVISMDLLRRIDINKIHELGIKTIVADEIQHFKNPDSSRTQELRRLVSGVDHFIALSGTPWKNRGSEYFSILNMLAPERFPNYNDFQASWVQYEYDKKTGKMRQGGIKRIPEFKEKTKDFIIRRMRDDVLPDLPKINRQLRYVELDKIYGESYEKAEGEVANIIKDALLEGKPMSSVAGEIMRLKHITGLAKVDACVEDIIEFLEDSEPWEKITIGHHHIDVGDRVEAKLNQYLTQNSLAPVIRLRGGEDGFSRNDKVEKFKSSIERRILLASTLASGEGLNLQFCQNAMLAERQWNPQNEEQFELRFSRPLDARDLPSYLAHIADTKSVSIRVPYLICANTVDELLVEIIERKRHNFRISMNDKDAELKLEENDILTELAMAIAKKRNKNALTFA